MIYLPEWLDDDQAGYEVETRKRTGPTRLAVGLEAILNETGRQKQARKSRYARKPAATMPNGVHRRGRKRLAVGS
jgi:hypothetical protein